MSLIVWKLYLLQLSQINNLQNFEIFYMEIQSNFISFTWVFRADTFNPCFLILIWSQTVLHHLDSSF